MNEYEELESRLGAVSPPPVSPELVHRLEVAMSFVQASRPAAHHRVTVRWTVGLLAAAAVALIAMGAYLAFHNHLTGNNLPAPTAKGGENSPIHVAANPPQASPQLFMVVDDVDTYSIIDMSTAVPLLSCWSKTPDGPASPMVFAPQMPQPDGATSKRL